MAIEKQKIILDILKITNEPTHPQLYEMYSIVASLAFLGHHPDLVNWALSSFKRAVNLYKFPRAIKQFLKIEEKIIDATWRRMNGESFHFDIDDDLFID